MTSTTSTSRRLRWAIRGYQNLRAGRPSPCRFEPSCSTYAMEALEVHGPARGSWLTIRRLSRCRPFGGQGWDPVPLSHDPAPVAGESHHDRTVA